MDYYVPGVKGLPSLDDVDRFRVQLRVVSSSSDRDLTTRKGIRDNFNKRVRVDFLEEEHSNFLRLQIFDRVDEGLCSLRTVEVSNPSKGRVLVLGVQIPSLQIPPAKHGPVLPSHRV